MMETNKIYQGDAFQVLKTFPDNSINCVMTSPPYWALRDYGNSVETIWDGKEGCEHNWGNKLIHKRFGNVGTCSQTGNQKNNVMEGTEDKGNFCLKCNAWKGQLGLEPSFDLYIKHLCDIFDEVKRVLSNDGTCWVNIGDTYSATRWTNNTDSGQPMNNFKDGHRGINPEKITGLEDKNLTLVPFHFAIEMQNRGWILRNVIIWHKPNCMPSSVKDRFTVDFEYVFFFVKNKKYWFETQYEKSIWADKDKRSLLGRVEHKTGKTKLENFQGGMNGVGYSKEGRNKRTVWTITTKPFSESHFATYPEKLCETPIKAGCPEFVCNKCKKAREKILESNGTGVDYSNKGNYEREISTNNPSTKFNRNAVKKLNAEYEFKGLSDCNCNAGFSGGIVLDPFFGAGTTGLVALKQNKKFIGIELNPEYIKIANERLKPFLEQKTLELSQ